MSGTAYRLAGSNQRGWSTLRLLMKSGLSFEFIFVSFLLSGTYKATSFGQALHVDATLLTGALTVMIGSIVVLRSGGIPRNAVPAAVSALLLLAWLGVTVAWSSGSDMVISTLVRGLALVGIAFAGAVCVVAPERRRVSRFLVIFALFCILLVLITFNLIPSVGGIDPDIASSRLARGVAMAVGAQVLLAIALLPTERWWVRLGAALLACLYLVAVLFAGTRQALIGLILALPVLMPIGIQTLRRSWIGVSVVGVIVLGVVLGEGPKVVRDLQTINRLEIFLSGQLGASGEGRVLRLQAAVNGFEAAPVFGNGMGSFGHFSVGGPFDYPHNAVIEVLFDGGLVGLLFLATAGALTLCRFLFELSRLRGLSRYALPSAVILLLFSSLVSNSIADNRLLWGFIGLCTIVAARSPLARTVSSADKTPSTGSLA